MPKLSEPYVRVSAVILKEGKILLIKRRKDKFFCLPGGRVEFGETLELALKREILEETNQKITVGPLLYLRDFIPSINKHVIEPVFLGKITSKRELTNNFDPCKKFEDYSLEWVYLADLPKIKFFPAFMKKALSGAIRREKRTDKIYVGKQK